ncbi:MAG TPA: signal peptidase II [Caldilineaceae bacterium]|nr:signal peptidase II [Caldilineaceae bacterium]
MSRLLTIVRTWFERAWPVLAIAAAIIALDQWTKEWVRMTIPKYTYTVPIPQLGEYFVFEHVDNYGAAFGILQNQGTLFILIAAVVAVAILVYVWSLPPQNRFVRVLLGLQLGGALGNVIDRLNQGYVTDFVKMGIPGVYYWPNYNIADAAIVCGVIGLGVYILVEDLRSQRAAKRQAADTPSGDSVTVSPQDAP